MIDLNNLEPGQSAVYYTGLSLAQVSPESKFTAWQMYMRDEADLTQRRVQGGEGSVEQSKFEYIVTRRKTPPRQHVIDRRKSYYSGLVNGYGKGGN